MKIVAIIFGVTFAGSSLVLVYRLHKRADINFSPLFFSKSKRSIFREMSTKLDSLEMKLAVIMVVSFFLLATCMALM